jgi:pyruvate/2-oxoglutarate dehydrogenase complex dihydrolipoamide acyltransferase (E2) component
MNTGVPILLERDNVNDDVVALSHCFVKDGEMVEAGRLIAEIETSKANVEVLAPEAGYLYWRFVEKAEIPLSEPIGHILPEPVPVGSLLVSLSRNSTASSGQSPTLVSPPIAVIDAAPFDGSQSSGEKSGLIFSSSTGYTQQISRSAQELMKAHNVSEKHFSGMALVRAEDVLAVVHGKPLTVASQARKETAPVKAAEAKSAREQSSVLVTEVPLSRMKKSEGRSLAEGAKNTIPSSVSVTCLTHGLRTALESDSVVAGSLGALVIYEAARLLRKYPAFNANHRSGVMLRYEQINIGYAVDDGRGLKVVVLRDCDQKSLGEITAELRDLVFAYLEDKLTPAQISDGTFTISDLSGSGVSSFVPLMSEGQGAILGVGSEQFIPGSKDGFYTLTLGFDHQLSEGRTAALFLNDLKDRLLNYEKAIVKEIHDAEIVACARCGRGSADLPDAKSYMVQSVVPPGYLCNLCMAGLG